MFPHFHARSSTITPMSANTPPNTAPVTRYDVTEISTGVFDTKTPLATAITADEAATLAASVTCQDEQMILDALACGPTGNPGGAHRIPANSMHGGAGSVDITPLPPEPQPYLLTINGTPCAAESLDEAREVLCDEIAMRAFESSDDLIAQLDTLGADGATFNLANVVTITVAPTTWERLHAELAASTEPVPAVTDHDGLIYAYNGARS